MKKIISFIMALSALVLITGCTSENGELKEFDNANNTLYSDVLKYASHSTRTIGAEATPITGTQNLSFGIFGGSTTPSLITDLAGGTEVDELTTVLYVDAEYNKEEQAFINILAEEYRVGSAHELTDNTLDFPNYLDGLVVDGVDYDKVSKLTYCGPELDENGEYWDFDYSKDKYTSPDEEGYCPATGVVNIMYKLEKGSIIDYYRTVHKSTFTEDGIVITTDALVAHKHDANGNGTEDSEDFEVVTRSKLTNFQNGKGYEVENTINIRKDFNNDNNLTNKEIASDITYDVNLLTNDTEDYAYHYEYRVYSNGQDNTVFRYILEEDTTISSKIFDWEIATDELSTNVAIGLAINYGYFPDGITSEDTLDNEITIFYNGDNTENNPGYENITSNALVFKMADSLGHAIDPIIELSSKEEVETKFKSFLDKIAGY